MDTKEINNNVFKIGEMDSSVQDSTFGNSDSMLTKFNSDAVVNRVEPQQVVTKETEGTNSALSELTFTLTSFLAREQMISSGLLSASDVTNNAVVSITHPQQILNNAVYKGKIDGFYGFKADLNLRLVINATRFQQGRYMLVFIYTGGTNFLGNIATFVQSHTSTLVQTTQLPHVEFDLSCDTEVSLRIPYVNSADFCLLNSTLENSYSIGRVQLIPYSPLVAGSGSTNAQYRLFASFDNVELTFPTVPQSGVRVVTKRKTRKMPTEEEAETTGPISSLALKVSNATAILSEIPLLSPITAPASWLANVISRSALAMGFSKPHDTVPMAIMQRRVPDRFTNVDTKDQSAKLAIYDNNVLSSDTNPFGTNVDEMAIDYVKTISAWFKTVTWTTEQAADTVIASLPMHPRYFVVQNVRTGRTITNLTPVAWLGTMFGLYRGGFKITLKFVKTEFHSGRLLFTFVPYDPVGGKPTPSSLASNSTYVFREIIDVRYKNEITIDVPYMSFTPYRLTNAGDTLSSYGICTLSVLNTLEAPNTVSSTVSILMEVSGNRDFEVAQPVDTSSKLLWTAVPQSGCAVSNSTMGSSKSRKIVLASAECIGEKVESLRALAKRQTEVGSLVYASTTDITVNPYFVPVNVWSGSAYTIYPDFPDAFSHIVSLYALIKGGVRFRLITRSQVDNTCFASLVTRYITNSVSNVVDWSNTTTYSKTVGLRPCTYTKLNLNDCLDFETPYYSKSASTPVACLTGNSGQPMYYNENVPNYSVWIKASTTFGAVQPVLTRGGADDFTAGVFVSTVPVIDWSAVE